MVYIFVSIIIQLITIWAAALVVVYLNLPPLGVITVMVVALIVAVYNTVGIVKDARRRKMERRALLELQLIHRSLSQWPGLN